MGRRRLRRLTALDARLDVCVGCLDEPVEGCVVYGDTGLELDVAHELARALEQAGRVWERRAVKEANVHVRGEDVDIAEGGVAEAGNRAAVMEQLADFVSAAAHGVKPPAGKVSQLAVVASHPGVDGGVAFDGAVEAEECVFHGRSPYLLWDYGTRWGIDARTG